MMKQEEKDLLLKDLFSRLPYGVKCKYYDHYEGAYDEGTIRGFERHEYMEIDGVCIHVEEVKPYLFPLSSMTDEQKEELEDMNWSFDDSVINNIVECLGYHRQFVTHFDCFVLIDWLNKKHFDYRGLIEKGLAIDCTNLNIY
jgi:hypothetical protein